MSFRRLEIPCPAKSKILSAAVDPQNSYPTRNVLSAAELLEIGMENS